VRSFTSLYVSPVVFRRAISASPTDMSPLTGPTTRAVSARRIAKASDLRAGLLCEIFERRVEGLAWNVELVVLHHRLRGHRQDGMRTKPWLPPGA